MEQYKNTSRAILEIKYIDKIRSLKLMKFKPTTASTKKARQLNVREHVQLRYYTANKNKCKFGIIIRKFGLLKRHIDQLRSTETPITNIRRSSKKM